MKPHIIGHYTHERLSDKVYIALYKSTHDYRVVITGRDRHQHSFQSLKAAMLCYREHTIHEIREMERAWFLLRDRTIA